MKVLVVFAGLLAFVASQQPYRDEIPIPYSFRYTAEGDEGSSSHQETSDASGRKVGSYSFIDADGISRIVEYTADEEGFKAVIRTNEPGTANINPANIIFESSAPSAFGGGGAVASSAGISSQTRPRPRPRPVSSPVAPSGGRRPGGVAYVLVPVSEAGGYY